MQLRDTHVQRLKTEHFDVVIVGGGINGAASAAALAGKGVKVALIDRGDFSGETSQHSSNLVWGGIKYMESYDFALVRKLCKSRNHLIRSFPSTVQEIRFLTTVDKGFRHHPRTLWLGTWLYWLMGNAFTRLPRYLNPKGIKAREPIVDTGNAVGGFEYSDAYLHDNDARFVFNFVRTALDYGAAAANYVESRGASRQGGHWVVDGWDHQAQTSLRINASVLINASGPWVDDHNQRSGQVTEHHHAYSKGIHLIVPRLTDHHRVLAFFADDGRLFFAIPMGPRTCIGTTDTREQRPEVAVTDQDVSFVLDNINKRLTLERPLTRSDVIASRCGVRPLAVKASADGQRDFLQMSRKHAIDTSGEDRHISIFGGKLTDCVNVGEEIVAEVAALGVTIPDPDARWYGEPHADDRREFMHQARLLELDTMTPASSSEALSTRLWRRYGLSAFGMLDQIRRDRRQGELLIAGTEYLRCELEHAASKEMITRMDDFLRRRSKIALVVDHESLRDAPGLEEAARILFGDDAEQQLQEYFHTHRPAPRKLA